MNHRTQMDWILLWNLLARFGNVRRCKIILKDSLKKLPGIGWAAQQNLYLFVSRSWEKDKEHFHSVLNYFVETNKPVQMLIFPEGTDFCKGTKQSSDKFAKKNNLPIYDYVLHPRTRGFSELVKVMRHGNVKSLLDVTVGYPVNIPWGFRSVILGNYPEQVHFNIKKYSIDELPEDTEELQQWCQDRWAEKEETLRQFYDKKHFNQPQILFAVPEKQMWRKMSLCLILWAAFVLLAFFLFYMSSFWCWYCLAGCLIYLILTVTGGAERVLLSANKRLNCSSR
ncbi:lysocardiolipin acyltransferase 1-like [Corticium candelabrum]|uniref:lysocardiolipin acyltransferase 1-like n=1 Tax=Corticium candelabrum TaxID=121492 RepID=UPI002E26739F|nr:lysocardiolipin acyltransferase 1-like [Corticium candelabrum]